jgi:hypothetical protein
MTNLKNDGCLFLFFVLIATGTIFDKVTAAENAPAEPPFEKVYIKSNQLLTTPEGIYYVNDQNQRRKVKTLLHDTEGLYVIFFTYECPLCGRRYENEIPDDEHGCPILMRQVHPKIWAK